jgi:hypothetical protein
MCQVAFQLAAHNRRSAAFPFDWVITSFDSIYAFLANEGAFFLDSDKVVFIDNRPIPQLEDGPPVFFVTETVYHFQFLHDFELSPNFMKDYGTIKEKYDRRIKRLLDVLHSNKKVLFIRRGITYQQAILLDDLLHTRYPQLNYTILALDSTEEIKYNWNLERVKNFYLRECIPMRWDGDPEAWLEILNCFPIKPGITDSVID